MTNPANSPYEPPSTKDPVVWKPIFIASLRDTGIIRIAAKDAGIAYSTALRHRAQDPEFARAWEIAQEEAIDTLEAAALKRARDGVTRERPVYFNGKLLYTEKVVEYSDRLLELLLKAKRPHIYRETIDHNHSISIMEAEAERIAEAEGIDKDAVMREAKRIMGI